MLVLAAWTLSCHLVVFAEGNLLDVLSLFPLLLIGAFWIWRKLPETSPRWRDRVEREIATPSTRETIAALAAMALIGLYSHNILLAWWLVAVFLSIGVWRSLRSEPIGARRPLHGRGAEAILWALAGLAVVLTLVCHRPDADDAFYLNVAVAAADLPTATLYADDTMHGIEGIGPYISIYRLHSYELLNGALSFVTGIPVQVCFYLISAPLFALLVPLAWARLFRYLEPEHWPIAVTTLVLVLALVGEEHRWYGNFSFVRIWQGKAILLSFVLPAILAYAIALGSRPSPRIALLLAGSLIAGVGCSSSGLWLAPTLAIMGLGSMVSRTSWKHLAVSAVTIAAFTLAMGLHFRSELNYISERVDTSLPAGDQLAVAITKVLGDGQLAALLLGVTALAWLFASRGLGRRFAAIAPAVVWLTLLNPYASAMVSSSVVGPSYWRALWALPIPVLLVQAMVSSFRLRAPASRLLWLLSLVTVVGVTARYGPSVLNQGLRLDFPGLKVEREAYGAAEEVVRVAIPASHVVAPPEVDVWIPTFHDRPYPLLVRTYLRIDKNDERAQRKLLTDLAKSARHRRREDLEAARKALDRFAVTALCFQPRHLQRDRNLRKMLRGIGFLTEGRVGPYEIWSRRTPPARAAGWARSMERGSPK